MRRGLDSYTNPTGSTVASRVRAVPQRTPPHNPRTPGSQAHNSIPTLTSRVRDRLFPRGTWQLALASPEAWYRSRAPNSSSSQLLPNASRLRPHRPSHVAHQTTHSEFCSAAPPPARSHGPCTNVRCERAPRPQLAASRRAHKSVHKGASERASSIVLFVGEDLRARPGEVGRDRGQPRDGDRDGDRSFGAHVRASALRARRVRVASSGACGCGGGGMAVAAGASVAVAREGGRRTISSSESSAAIRAARSSARRILSARIAVHPRRARARAAGL